MKKMCCPICDSDDIRPLRYMKTIELSKDNRTLFHPWMCNDCAATWQTVYKSVAIIDVTPKNIVVQHNN